MLIVKCHPDVTNGFISQPVFALAGLCVCVQLPSSSFQPRFMRFILGNCQPVSAYCVRNFSAPAAARLICSAQLFVTQISPVRDANDAKVSISHSSL